MSGPLPPIKSRSELVVENMRLRAALRRIQEECLRIDVDPAVVVVDVRRYATNALAGRDPAEDGELT